MYTSTTRGEMPWAGEMPGLVYTNGQPVWQSHTGRTFPLIVAGAEDPPPAPKTEDPKPPAAGDPAGEEGDDFDRDRALATIKKLRDGEKALKAQLKELDTLKAKQQERDDADRSESEKLTAKIAELERKATAAEQQLTETRNRQAIERAATKAGAIDPDDVYRGLNAKDFELDADGTLTNAEELVKALLKAKPHFVASTNGTTNGVPATPKGSDPQAVSDEDRSKRAVGIRSYW